LARLNFDLAAAVSGVVGQLALVDGIVSRIDAADFDLPTRLGTWRVAELVAHLGSSNLPRYLSGASAAKATISVVDWARNCPNVSADVDDRARALTDDARPAQLRSLLRETRLAVTASLAKVSPTFVVPARFGAIAVADYLASRCVELTVHTLDLTEALGLEPALDPIATAIAVRLLAGVLAANAPGRSVEVRIPPHAVVQCVEGPRHTRGTPPNVIETDPVTWLELATGRLSWRDAIDTSRLSASGERADLAGLLPILS
jgi:uncharacterized protein (TIGR03083 family)